MPTNRCKHIQRRSEFLKLSVSTAYRYTFILIATFGYTYVFVFPDIKKSIPERDGRTFAHPLFVFALQRLGKVFKLQNICTIIL